MTHIKTNCPICGDIEIFPQDLILILRSSERTGSYRGYPHQINDD